MRALAVIVALLGGAWLWNHHRHTADEHALAAVASQIAGRSVEVQCQGFVSELVDINNRAGDVPFPNGRAPNHTYLTRKVCADLTRFRTSSTHHALGCLLDIDWSRWSIESDYFTPCARRARAAAEAINTLTHESFHLRGFVDEAQTQCYAIQEDAWTTERLGGTAAEGGAVASFILALQPALPTEYQSSECRAGGSLDLHPETPAFPTEPTPQLPPAGLYGPAVTRA
jgi:hypothetical protein